MTTSDNQHPLLPQPSEPPENTAAEQPKPLDRTVANIPTITTDINNGPVEVKFDNSDEQGPLPLLKIKGISHLNPRNHELDKSTKDMLTTSLEIVGQLNPITLRKLDANTLKVLCGGRRYKRIKEIRGEDGVLQPNEYRVVTCSDLQALRLIADENNARLDFSPCEKAELLLKAKGLNPDFTQDMLAEQFGFDRSSVSDLLDLANDHSLLPKEWQTDLAKVASDDEESPRIRFSHYRRIRGKLSGKNKKVVRDLMIRAHADRWSVAELNRQLDIIGVKSTKPKVDKTQPAEDSASEAEAASSGNDVVDAQGEVNDSAISEQHVPGAEIDYPAVAAHLEEVASMVRNDKELHKGATKLLKLVMARTKEGKQKKAA